MKIKLACCLIFLSLSLSTGAFAAEQAPQSSGLNAPANLSSAVLNSNPNFNNNFNNDEVTAQQKSAKDNLPDKVSLSANRMRFDSQTGDFLAEGNVIIKAGDLTVTAPKGTGNVERQEVFFDSGIKAFGKWQGEKIDLNANKVALTLHDDPTCRLEGNVKGGYAAAKFDADKVTLVGTGGITGLTQPSNRNNQTKFWLVNARNLEDTSKKIAFGAGNIEGVIRRGVLQDLTARKNVWLRGRPQANKLNSKAKLSSNEPVNLRGDNAVYSLIKGSVVLTGNVSAVQGGRTLKSDSLVYFPDQNRVEAMGGLVSRRDGKVDTERAEITIDLSAEKKSEPKKAEPKAKNNKAKNNKNKAKSNRKVIRNKKK